VNVSAITFYDNQRQNQIAAPTSPCPAGGCQNCLLPVSDYQYTYFPGDVLFGTMVGLRGSGADSMSCEGTGSMGPEAMMALKFALGNYRDVLGSNILPGVDIGALMADTCMNKYVSASFIRDVVTGRKTFKDSVGGNIDTEYLRSFINFRTSDVAEETSLTLGQYMIPEIESAATSSHLKDRMMYPYFNRAIPANDIMCSAMINILKRMGWTCAQIIYGSGTFGENGMQVLKEQAAKSQICITGAYSTSLDASVIVDKLRDNSHAKAVLVFGYKSHIRDILQAVRDKNAFGEFVFIGNDLWADREDIVSGYENITDGSLSVKQALPQVNLFNQHLSTFSNLDAIRADPVLSKLYEYRYNCYLNAGNRGVSTQPCTFQHITSTGSYSPFVINSVYATAQALHNTLVQVCGSGYNGLCNDFRDKITVSPILLSQIRNVSFRNILTGETFGLTNGEGTADFDIFNYQNGNGFVNVSETTFTF